MRRILDAINPKPETGMALTAGRRDSQLRMFYPFPLSIDPT